MVVNEVKEGIHQTSFPGVAQGGASKATPFSHLSQTLAYLLICFLGPH